jgi:hypothetical protein
MVSREFAEQAALSLEVGDVRETAEKADLMGLEAASESGDESGAVYKVGPVGDLELAADLK